ncbi:MAG: ATP-grasp domain-containing protein [Bacteroidales bacterium]|nr:ATP-grasp domain-containing protein [Bacteroidales bacterium]
MKQRFLEGGIPCAKGRLVKSIDETSDLILPVIVKPRDNSGSRGVKLCRTREELKSSMAEALEYSKLDSVLVEEFIEGQEYSIEGLHYDGKSEVIQFTEKKTTEFPYNVELGHKQPALLTEDQKDCIREIVCKIGKALRFENCTSHTELKINDCGVFVIETSPRLGGDYITSTLVPLSTGINMEDQLLNIALGKAVDIKTGKTNKASGVEFFQFPEGVIESISPKICEMTNDAGLYFLDLKLKEGDEFNKITSSLNRYGAMIIEASSRIDLDELMNGYHARIMSLVHIKK